MEFLNGAASRMTTVFTIGDDTTCPCCGPDTSQCPDRSTRESQAGVGIGAESHDVSQALQSSYDTEAFSTSSTGGIE
jgi:hypothetical protein